MRRTDELAWTGFATAALLAAAATAPALATPGNGFAPTGISVGHYGALDVKADKVEKWDLLLKSKDDTDVGVDKLTVQPGGYSGWHSHPAPIFVTVLTGSIQWYDGGDPICGWKTYQAGEAFIEPAFGIHNVRNTGSSVAEFTAVRVAPTGLAVRQDENKPTNCAN